MIAEVPVLPNALEDHAALARYRRRNHVRRPEIFALPPEDRSRSIAAQHKQRLADELRRQGKCEQCMLQLKYCICQSLSKLAAAATHKPSNIRFVVLMHIQERGRASNTGKLLQHILSDTEVLLQGSPEDDERLALLIESFEGRAAVLFPSTDAIPAGQWRSRTHTDGCIMSPDQPLLVVIVDGTWRQAKRMHRFLEGLPHIALSPQGLSEFHWRRQSQEGRISTVEAAAALLEEFGDSPAADGLPMCLRKALYELNSALERQCHHDCLVAAALPEPSERKRAANATRLPKRMPGHRSAA